MLLKLLSPISVLAGLIAAAVALAVLWPVDEYGTGVAVMAFALGAGLFEVIRRMKGSPAPPPTADSKHE